MFLFLLYGLPFLIECQSTIWHPLDWKFIAQLSESSYLGFYVHLNSLVTQQLSTISSLCSHPSMVISVHTRLISRSAALLCPNAVYCVLSVVASNWADMRSPISAISEQNQLPYLLGNIVPLEHRNLIVSFVLVFEEEKKIAKN